MAISELRKILKQVHSPNEYTLDVHDLNHARYWIFKVSNGKLSDLDSKLRPLRNEHARFDIFINGQYILEKDYTYELNSSDIIKLEGDVETV
jgi:hypothetical protein